jgi:hypothetical protein
MSLGIVLFVCSPKPAHFMHAVAVSSSGSSGLYTETKNHASLQLGATTMDGKRASAAARTSSSLLMACRVRDKACIHGKFHGHLHTQAASVIRMVDLICGGVGQLNDLQMWYCRCLTLGGTCTKPIPGRGLLSDNFN